MENVIEETLVLCPDCNCDIDLNSILHRRCTSCGKLLSDEQIADFWHSLPKEKIAEIREKLYGKG